MALKESKFPAIVVGGAGWGTDEQYKIELDPAGKFRANVAGDINLTAEDDIRLTSGDDMVLSADYGLYVKINGNNCFRVYDDGNTRSYAGHVIGTFGGSFPYAGAMQYSGGHFQGYHDGAWVDLDASSGASSINDLSDGSTEGNSNLYLGEGSGPLGSYNTGVGYNCLPSITVDGQSNSAFGTFALFDLTSGSGNTAVGHSAMSNLASGDYNTSVGYFSMRLGGASTSEYNIAIGYYALGGGSFAGTDNIAMGYHALYKAGLGSHNFAVGNNSLAQLTTGDHNIVMGYMTSYALLTGDNNVALGQETLRWLTTGSNNVVAGYRAGHSLSGASSNNTMLGAFAGGDNTTAEKSGCVCVGYWAGRNTSISSNELWIANTNTTTPLILGVFPNTSLTFTAADVILTGALTVPVYTPGTTTNKIYNIGGALYFNGAAVGGGLTWTRVTASTTATSGNGYLVDATSNSVSISLPASPSEGDIVAIQVYDAAYTVLVNRNTKNIEGATFNPALTKGDSATFVYAEATEGWVRTGKAGGTIHATVSSTLTTVDTFTDSVSGAAQYMYYIVNAGTNFRSGTIRIHWDGVNNLIEKDETSVTSIGDTSDFVFTADIDTGMVRLRGDADASYSVRLVKTMI